MSAPGNTTDSDAKAISLCLDLDERAVLSRAPGSFLPAMLSRASWSLGRRGLVCLCGPRRISLTEEGRAVRSALLDGVEDEPFGWGILLVGRGPDSWWCGDASGYTCDIAKAGAFSQEFALARHGGVRCNAGRDVAVPPARMRELLDAALADARATVLELEQRSFRCSPTEATP